MRLEYEKRAALSRLLREGRKRKGWNTMTTAEEATAALRGMVGNSALDSPEEVEIAKSSEVSDKHVSGLENCPASPLGTAERRLRLLAIVAALGLDRGEVSRAAGGI